MIYWMKRLLIEGEITSGHPCIISIPRQMSRDIEIINVEAVRSSFPNG
jgi:hypothetical protein